MQNLAIFGKYSLGIVASLGLAASSLIFSPTNPAAAQSSDEEIHDVDASFLCKKVNNRWTTIANSSLRQGDDIPFIVYKSNYFRNAGYDNQKRCQMVSRRLNELFHNGQLDYVTSGIVNRQPVICGVRSNSETCARYNVILTLKEREDANDIIKHLFDLKRGFAVGPIPQARPEDQEPIPSHLSLKDIIRNAPSP
jgi:hypothetical protein